MKFQRKFWSKNRYLQEFRKILELAIKKKNNKIFHYNNFDNENSNIANRRPPLEPKNIVSVNYCLPTSQIIIVKKNPIIFLDYDILIFISKFDLTPEEIELIISTDFKGNSFITSVIEKNLYTYKWKYKWKKTGWWVTECIKFMENLEKECEMSEIDWNEFQKKERQILNDKIDNQLII